MISSRARPPEDPGALTPRDPSLRDSVVNVKPHVPTIRVFVLFAVFAAHSSHAFAQIQRVHRPRYELVEIPSLHPTGYAYAGGINQRGDVCGTSMAPNGLSEHAFLYSDGMPTDAHTGWDTYSWGDDLTDERAVHGYSNVSNVAVLTCSHSDRHSGGATGRACSGGP